jgi:hypothetical protein
MRYLPDYHEFEYIASTPWPHYGNQQLDWVDRIDIIETWLTRSVGPHYREWAWHPAQDICFAAVAFRWERSKSMFLLRWGSF